MRDRVLFSAHPPFQRVHKTVGPAPADVPFLAAFAQRRSPTFGPLRPSLGSVINTPTELYGFIQYMKSVEAVGVLQLFLSLSGWSQRQIFIDSLSLSVSVEELKGALERHSIDEAQLASSLASLNSLHHTHLSPSSPSLVPLTPDPSPSLMAALSPSLSPTQQWACLQDSRLVQRLYLQVYHVLEDTYFPQYCQSEQVSPIPIPHTFILPCVCGTPFSLSLSLSLGSSIPSIWGSSQTGSGVEVAWNEDTPLVWNGLQKRGMPGDFPTSPPPLLKT